jgi:hypothetical protein
VVTRFKRKNGDNLNNVRLKANRHFRNKKMKYLKDKINEMAEISKNGNYIEE